MFESKHGLAMPSSTATWSISLGLTTIPSSSPSGRPYWEPVLRQTLDQGVSLPPSSPLSLPLRNPSPPPSSSQGLLVGDHPLPGLMTSLWSQSTSCVQRSHPSNPYLVLWFDLQRLLRKKMDQNLDIFEQVFCSVVKEYWDGGSHDVLVMSCSSPLLYVTNVLYNFSNLGYDKLCS